MIIRRSDPVFIAILAAFVLLLVGCGGRDAEAAPAGDHATPAVEGAPARQYATAAPDTVRGQRDHAAHDGHGEPPAAGDAAEHSLYVLPAAWTDQDGRALASSDLAGPVRVVAMVYTHCSFACPRIVAMMKRVEETLAEEGLADGVELTLVSIDPERDTPERLADFARQMRLDRDRWRLLTGSESDVRALSVLLGVKYGPAGEDEFSHSNVLTVLDPDGVPVARVEGLGVDVEPVLHAIRTELSTS